MLKNFDAAREVHSEMYDYIEVDITNLDKWEEHLTNHVYGIRKKVDDYVKNSSNAKKRDA